MPKKLISVLLAAALFVSLFVVAVISVSATDNIYMVESDIYGENGSGDGIMTEQSNGAYIKLYPDVPAGDYCFKIVENGVTVISDAYDSSFNFRVNSTCDVIITYNPTTGKVDFLGDSVTSADDLEIEHISVVGNGQGSWLNNQNWDFDWVSTIRYNSLSRIADDIYTITYYEVVPSADYRFEFVVNGSWTNSFGLEPSANIPDLDKPFELDYNGDSIILNTVKYGYALSDITLTVDLSGFDYHNKKGAKLTVEVADSAVRDPSLSATQAQSTPDTPNSTLASGETVPPTTVDPLSGVLNLTVNATSNYFPENSARYNPNTKEVTVTFLIKSSRKMLDTQWYATYDPEILSVSDKNKLSTVCPVVNETGSSLVLNEIKDGVGYIRYAASSLELYDTSSDPTTFASIVFGVRDVSEKAPVSTTVDLVVDVLRVSSHGEDSNLSDSEREVLLVDKEVVYNDRRSQSVNVNMRSSLTPATYTEPTTVEPTETDLTSASSATNASGSTEVSGTDTTQKTSELTTQQTSVQYSEKFSSVADSSSATKDTADSDEEIVYVKTGGAAFSAIALILVIAATVIIFVMHKKEIY